MGTLEEGQRGGEGQGGEQRKMYNSIKRSIKMLKNNIIQL